VLSGEFDMDDEDWGHVSEPGKALVRQLLSYKPADRPTAAQLLQNSWVQQNMQQQQQQQQQGGSESDAGCAADTE
jgi:calcium-dependent protein kinase